jgi:hypothetical protein
MDLARRSSLPDSPDRTPGFEGWLEACAEIEADLPVRSESFDRLRQTIEAELDALQSALTEERERRRSLEQELEAEQTRPRGGDAELEAERKRLREELERSDEQRRRLAKRLTEWRSQIGKSVHHEAEGALKRAEAREAACREELRSLQEETARTRKEHERHVRTFAQRIAELESSLAAAEASAANERFDDDLLLRSEASERRCVELEAELVSLRAAAAAREGELTHDDEVRELRVELELYRESEAALRKESAELREKLEQAKANSDDVAENEERLAAFALASADRIAEDERRDSQLEELRRELADVERDLAQEREIRRSLEEERQAAEGVASSGSGDLQRRYEFAMDDVRSLKRRVLDLEDEVRRAKSSGGAGASAAAGGALDWESQKRRLLEQLSEESDESLDADERTAIENAIKMTDEVIAEKEAELEELRRLLEYRSAMVPDAAVGAAALGAVLDADELIVEERERLKGLQKEWEEKLRSAEVDLSLERARLSRERLELDDARREIDEFRKEFAAASKKPGSKTEPGSPKRRWMFRLGLSDEE